MNLLQVAFLHNRINDLQSHNNTMSTLYNLLDQQKIQDITKLIIYKLDI